jgi:hypothetical protein
MRRAAWICVAILSLPGGPLPAQTPSAPHLYVSMFGGYRAGGRLWTSNDQPFAVFVRTGSGLQRNPGYDTLDLQQQVVPGFVIGAAGTYFPHPHLGIEGEITFLGLGLESRCAIRRSQPADTADVDPELCASLNGGTTSLSAVSFSAGVVARLLPDKPTSPYVLASVGLVTRTRSTIEMIGVYADPTGLPATAGVLADSTPNKTTPHFTLGAGAAFPLGPSYQLRVEGRDVITRLDRVTGPADPSGGTLYPPHGGKVRHNFVFAVAFDVILEKRRGRRY